MLKRSALWTTFLAWSAIQCIGDTHQTGKLEWRPSYKTFQCDSAITINVSWSGSNDPDVMFGIEADASLGQDTQIAVGSVLPWSVDQSSSKTFANVPERLTEVAACVYRVDAVGGSGRRIAIHARMASNKRVIFAINGQTSADFVVNNGAVVYGGKWWKDTDGPRPVARSKRSGCDLFEGLRFETGN